MGLAFAFEDDVIVAGHWRNLTITDMGGMLKPTHPAQIIKLLNLQSGRFPQGVVSISLVRPSTPLADRAVLNELAESMKPLNHRILRMVVALESVGMAGSAMRSMVRATLLLSRNRRVNVVSTAEECIPLAQPLVTDPQGRTATTEEVGRMVAQVRQRYQDITASR